MRNLPLRVIASASSSIKRLLHAGFMSEVLFVLGKPLFTIRRGKAFRG